MFRQRHALTHFWDEGEEFCISFPSFMFFLCRDKKDEGGKQGTINLLRLMVELRVISFGCCMSGLGAGSCPVSHSVSIFYTTPGPGDGPALSQK